jgi:hypothetical protein
MTVNRRKYERYSLAEEVVALDEQGQRLGRVIDAGGGGMAIRLDSVHPLYQPGERLRLRIVEPGNGIQHTLEVSIVYVNQNSVGVRFLAGEKFIGLGGAG